MAIFLVIGGIPFVTTILLTPLIRYLANRRGVFDRPSSWRRGPLKPRLGGIAIYVGVMIALILSFFLVEQRTQEELRKLWGIIIGATIVTIMGSIDDKRELGALPQFAFQLLASFVAMGSGILIDRFTNPVGASFGDGLIDLPLYAAVVFTLFWMVGAMNTINFIDGLDGLATGITVIASVILFIHSFNSGQYTISLLPLALAGATLGFLPHNFYPARITMGTSGAVFLGFTLASLSIVGGAKAASMLLVLCIPIADAGWIILRRIWLGRSPFQGDRSHIHHQLIDMGLSPRKSVLLLYGMSTASGLLALALPSPLLKLYALAGLVLIFGGFLLFIAQKSLRTTG